MTGRDLTFRKLTFEEFQTLVNWAAKFQSTPTVPLLNMRILTR
jgi:hypothetical protein